MKTLKFIACLPLFAGLLSAQTFVNGTGGGITDPATFRTKVGISAFWSPIISTTGPGNDMVMATNGAGVYTPVTKASLSGQPLDSDLTSIAALTTTSFGRSLLTSVNGADLAVKAGMSPIDDVHFRDITSDGVLIPQGDVDFSESDIFSFGENTTPFREALTIGPADDVTFDEVTATTGFHGDGSLLTGIADLATTNTYTAGAKQKFLSSATTAGLSLDGSLTANPSTTAAGDVWFRSDTSKLYYAAGVASAKPLVTESDAATLTYKNLTDPTNTFPTFTGSQISGGTFGAVNGSALTALNGANISSGNIAVARIATALTTPGPIGGTTRDTGAFSALTVGNGTTGTLTLGDGSFTKSVGNSWTFVGGVNSANDFVGGNFYAGSSGFFQGAEVRLGVGGGLAKITSDGGTKAIGFFPNTSTEAGRFSTSNNLLLGTTTDAATGKLQVTGNTALTGNLTVSGTATISGQTELASTQASTTADSAMSRGLIDDRLVNPANMFLVDEFLIGSSTSTLIGEIGWNSYGPGASLTQPAGTSPNVGLVTLATGASANNASTIYASGMDLLTSTNWEICYVVALNQTTTCDLIVGVTADNGAIGIGNYGGTSFGVRYSTGAGDTNFMFFSKKTNTDWAANDANNYSLSSGVAANTSFHTFRMRSTVAGTVQMKVDGGSWTAVTMVSTSGTFYPFFYISTRTTATKAAKVDFWSFKQTGLSR